MVWVNTILLTKFLQQVTPSFSITKIRSIHTDSTLQLHDIVLSSRYKGMLNKLCIACITLEGNCLEHDCVKFMDTNICMNSSLHYQTTYWQAWCSGVIPCSSLQSARQEARWTRYSTTSTLPHLKRERVEQTHFNFQYLALYSILCNIGYM